MIKLSNRKQFTTYIPVPEIDQDSHLDIVVTHNLNSKNIYSIMITASDQDGLLLGPCASYTEDNNKDSFEILDKDRVIIRLKRWFSFPIKAKCNIKISQYRLTSSPP